MGALDMLLGLPGLIGDAPALTEERQLVELLRRYGIPEDNQDCYRLLTLKLVREFHPDFRARKKRGRPRQWSKARRMMLLETIKLLRGNHPKWSEERACQEFLDLWSGTSVLPDHCRVATLRRQLQNAKKEASNQPKRPPSVNRWGATLLTRKTLSGKY